MTERDPTQPTEHERRVAEEEERTGREGATDPYAGDADRPGYEEEIARERTGGAPDEDLSPEEEMEPPDVAYKPKSG